MRNPALRWLCALSFAVFAVPPLHADENENRARATLRQMESLASAVMVWMSAHRGAPDVTSVEALVPLLTPTYLSEVPLRDGWETPFRYARLGPQSFRIVSAGADRQFDETSWNTAAQTEDLGADAVYVVKRQYEAGAFHRYWRAAAAAKELAQPLVDAELEKMKGMSPAQGRSYLRTSFTLRDLEVVGLFLEAYRLKHGRYPAARSMAELEPMLFPEIASAIPTKDKWGTELRYVVSPDGKSYRLVSAGEDATFDEASWMQKGYLASADDDAVVENGEVVRKWTTETQPGLGARAKLKPEARALLAQADARLEAEDDAGALQAYIAAVKADRAAADLEAIQRYAPRGGDAAAHIAALRQFLEIHPGNTEAERDLAILLPDAEGVAFAGELVKKHPRDAELYRLRSQLLFRAGRTAEGLADLEHAVTLDPGNAELYYMIGVVAYELVAKDAALSEQQKRDLLRRGFAAFDRAESLRADYFEALAYRNLLLREQAKLESDPALQQKLIAEADALRQRAVAIINARRVAPAPTTDGPYRVGGDVKAPLLLKRVEPVIPEEALEAHVSGIVIIEAVINKEGRVVDAKVLKPLPFGVDVAALEAVKQWTWEPGTLNGQPVDVIFNMTVTIKRE